MILSIIVTFLLVFYGGIFMMSPMMIASQGFSNSLSSILFALLLLGYPVLIFLLMTLLDIPFYGTESSGWLIGFSIPFILAILFYHIPLMLYNISRGISNIGYHIDEKGVYLYGRKIKKADPRTFAKTEDSSYYKDASHVFYRGIIIPKADPNTFCPVFSEKENDPPKYHYWKDKTHVYHNGSLIKEADPDSILCLKSLYAKDAKNMYYAGFKIEDAHPEDFHFLNEGIAVDQTNVFVYGKKSETPIDIETFEIVDDDDHTFYRDRNSVFLPAFQDADPLLKVEKADPLTFKNLGRDYASDARNVYYRISEGNMRHVKILENADPISFNVGYDHSTKSDARDKNHCYMCGKIINRLSNLRNRD